MAEHISVDKTGISLSALCLVHCLTGPLLIAVAPNFHVFANETVFHLFLGPFLVFIAAVALYRGYRHHGQKPILVLGLIGVGFLAAGILAPHDENAVSIYTKQAVLSVIGSVLLISAHVWNLRSCRHGHAQHAHEHDHGHDEPCDHSLRR